MTSEHSNLSTSSSSAPHFVTGALVPGQTDKEMERKNVPITPASRHLSGLCLVIDITRQTRGSPVTQGWKAEGGRGNAAEEEEEDEMEELTDMGGAPSRGRTRRIICGGDVGGGCWLVIGVVQCSSLIFPFFFFLLIAIREAVWLAVTDA